MEVLRGHRGFNAARPGEVVLPSKSIQAFDNSAARNLAAPIVAFADERVLKARKVGLGASKRRELLVKPVCPCMPVSRDNDPGERGAGVVYVDGCE